MNKKFLLIGGGGHCKSVLDNFLTTGHYTEIGIIDKKKNIEKNVNKVKDFLLNNKVDLKKKFYNCEVR